MRMFSTSRVLAWIAATDMQEAERIVREQVMAEHPYKDTMWLEPTSARRYVEVHGDKLYRAEVCITEAQ